MSLAANTSLFRLGMATGLVGIVIFLFVALALYRLLSGVNSGLASVMVIFVIISVAIECVNVLTDAAALELIRGPDFLSVFDKPQREALARLSLNLHFQSFVVNEIFWGLWLLPLGLLVYRSGFLPRLWLDCGVSDRPPGAGILRPRLPLHRADPARRGRLPPLVGDYGRQGEGDRKGAIDDAFRYVSPLPLELAQGRNVMALPVSFIARGGHQIVGW